MTAPRSQSITWSIPVIASCDVCVIGGGSAGIAASVAAGRSGAKTVLVERYGFLGGTSTAGMVGPFMTSWSADGKEPIIAGVFRELVDRMIALGGAIDPATIEPGGKWTAFISLGHANATPFSVEACKLAAMQLVDEAGVELWFHTSFIDTCVENGAITAIVVHNKGGLGLIEAKHFVDCSADADVAARAGAPFVKGRESDGLMMPATMFMRLGNVDDAAVEAHARAHPDERLFMSIVQKAKEEGRWNYPREYLLMAREPEPGVYRCNITRMIGIDGTNPRDLSRAEVQGRRECLMVFEFLRANCPGLAHAKLLETAAQVGIRETRHIVGRYTLTADDVLEGRRFPDAIGRCSYPVDIHDLRGTRSTLIMLGGHVERATLSAEDRAKATTSAKPANPAAPTFYDIPYRILLPQKVGNLLVAGRPVSATHEAAASVRVIPPCYAMGQAAGLAAALAARGNVAPADLDTDVLRRELMAQGAIV
ncbi:MAG: FAD-dependent oxidoreductase [Alphaproteobacteria bacterium]|nr:FAD-dependent oxidoreductase [Alphaproteobacteria bacterium]